VNTQQRIVKFVSHSNWILLITATCVALICFAPQVSLGIAAGGLIVTVNFHLLARTLRKALRPPHIASIRGPLIKYYVRFLITAVIIFILIRTNSVDPIGLVAGLSVVVASMILATLNEVRQLLCKEAG
jgi:large-conductance mechanosensitive channel